MKIVSSRREEFRRLIRSHSQWSKCRNELNLPKNPDSEQWLQAAYYLCIDPEPYSVDADTPEPDEDPKPSYTVVFDDDKPTPAPNKQTADLASALAAMVAASKAPDAPAIDDKHIIDLIHKHTKEPIKVTVIHKRDGKPDYEHDAGAVHRDFAKCLDVLKCGHNLQMVGPAGSGKTTLAKQLHKALFADRDETPMYAFTGALSQEYKLFGFIDANGTYRETPFYRVYKFGGTFLFDEYDGSLPNAVLPFNTALDNGHCDFPHECTPKHADTIMISACNTYGNGADRQYVGRYQQDAAALERWTPINIDYDEELEKTFTDNASWCARVQRYRRAIFTLKIRHMCSPRATIKGADYLECGWSMDDVEQAVIWKGLEADTIKKIREEAGL